MGLLISRWRKQPSREEQLEKIDKDIKSIQEFKHHNQQRLSRYVGYLIFYSTIIYIIGALVILVFFLPPDWQGRILASLPLLLVPVLIVLVKKTVHWYYVTKITSSDEKLADLRAEKKRILSEVMENETYKKAKEILDKYDPDSAKKMATEENKDKPSMIQLTNTELRQRFPPGGAPPPYRGQGSLGSSPPRGGGSPGRPVSNGPPVTPHPNHMQRSGPPPGPPLPRPILPRERSTVERMVEYLVGDGPGQRYALVCKACYSHNGMAMREEFEFIAFRCAYCHVFNPPRRAKPQPPKLDDILGTPAPPGATPGGRRAAPPGDTSGGSTPGETPGDTPAASDEDGGQSAPGEDKDSTGDVRDDGGGGDGHNSNDAPHEEAESKDGDESGISKENSPDEPEIAEKTISGGSGSGTNNDT